MAVMNWLLALACISCHEQHGPVRCKGLIHQLVMAVIGSWHQLVIAAISAALTQFFSPPGQADQGSVSFIIHRICQWC